jgi:hypothetical protein
MSWRRQQGQHLLFLSQAPMQRGWYWCPQNSSAVVFASRQIVQGSSLTRSRLRLLAIPDHTNCPPLLFIWVSLSHSTQTTTSLSILLLFFYFFTFRQSLQRQVRQMMAPATLPITMRAIL